MGAPADATPAMFSRVHPAAPLPFYFKFYIYVFQNMSNTELMLSEHSLQAYLFPWGHFVSLEAKMQFVSGNENRIEFSNFGGEVNSQCKCVVVIELILKLCMEIDIPFKIKKIG